MRQFGNRIRVFLSFAISLAATSSLADATDGAEWRAGAAKTAITPTEPIWMSGYGSRDHAAEGTLHDLWCKALAIEDPNGTRALLVSLDLCGISKSVSDEVCARLKLKLGLDRAAIMIACSHTHTGPMIENNLETMFELSAEENAKIKSYTRSLEDKIVTTATEAFAKLEPARLAWANGTATYAVNRRNNPEAKVPELRERGELKGPIDHDVPVLCVRSLDGQIRSVVFGSACHATVLSFYQWSGDHPGFAQIELEKNHPGAVALFFAGCGADQNPLPRRTVEHAEQYGKELAASVDAVLRGAMNPLGDRLAARFELLDLPFESVPSSEELKTQIQKGNAYEKRRAKILLARVEKGQRLSPSYPYPVQVWKFADETAIAPTGKRTDQNSALSGQNSASSTQYSVLSTRNSASTLTWIALGGEVTVGYSLRLKRELGPGRTWVAGYANDVMAYIPTRRVWDEGGYEGAGAMVYYGLPTRWSSDVEELIVTKVHELVEK
jgi:hypothetical protein